MSLLHITLSATKLQQKKETSKILEEKRVRSEQLYFQDRRGRGRDAETMVGAMTYQPKDIVVGVGDNHLTTLDPETDLTVCEIVADELRAVHAEGHKTVSRLGDPDGQRKFNLFFIKCSAII